MNTYILHWMDGNTEEVQGNTIAEAFNRAGYGHGALKALDYYEQKKNTPQTREDLLAMVQASLDKLENEAKIKQDNSGYNVQYLPCGHSRELRWNEHDLVARAKKRISEGYLDALTLHSSRCPYCSFEYQPE